MTETHTSRSALTRLVLIRYFEALVALALMFFLTAGTLAYWEGWLYLGILFIPMAFVMIYLIKYDPELLERRMRFREKEKTQKRVINFGVLWFLLAFLLPGLDFRFGWSNVPLWVVLGAAALTLLGYLMVFWVFRENRYASRVVEVAEGQQEGAIKGFNPKKPGNRCYNLQLAFCDDIKAYLTGYVRCGDTYTANGTAEMIKEIVAQLKKIWRK